MIPFFPLAVLFPILLPLAGLFGVGLAVSAGLFAAGVNPPVDLIPEAVFDLIPDAAVVVLVIIAVCGVLNSPDATAANNAAEPEEARRPKRVPPPADDAEESRK